MRRERRLKTRRYNFFYTVGALVILLAITLIVLYRIYSNKLNEISKSMLSSEEIIGLVPNNTTNDLSNTEKVSSSLSKTIEEVEEDLNNNVQQESTNIAQNTEVIPEEETKETKKELVFGLPVEGEISQGFAIESLIYSETLEEWTTHQGIDIKADRTTVVKASEEGTVVAIKNDPRYGLTVIVEHEDGYKTVYSNLLTTEFVCEDEKVEKGQSLGTVGNSAAFEIASEPHLHFEILKDDQYIDPTLYIK